MHLKPFFSYEQQLESLKEKGIFIDDPVALGFLKSVNYYRFSAFILPFKGRYENLLFSRIKRIYEFDCKLRALLFPVIESIEIRLRAVISYVFAEKYGAEGYLKEINFSSKHDHAAFKLHLARCIKDNRTSLVVMHHEKKYDGHYPFWVVVEFFSLGMLSYFYSDLLRDDKKAIAKALGCKSDEKLESWLRCLTDLRNRCAHYSRLYYWNFTSIPLLYKEDNVELRRSLYAYLLMLHHLAGDTEIWEKEFNPNFATLVQEYSEAIVPEHIGLPKDWENSLTRH